mmetsp:Transcript_2854/g.8204  ORF Transcript_2854/g.8204 Transcript_2854/m.8204 type:complete len:439 (+) Transcript_2854:1-1317(+)
MRAAYVRALVLHFQEQGPTVQPPQVVNYLRFVRDVDEVFFVAAEPAKELSATWEAKSGLLSPADSERVIQHILPRIALLTKTRGIVLKACFVDCERSDAVSLVCPRYSGKATLAQFRKHFPFKQDFSPRDLRLLAKHYMNEGGDVFYRALCKDIASLVGDEDRQALDDVPMLSPRGSGRRAKTNDARYPAELTIDGIIAKIRGLVSERRLQISNMFIDFDRLRHGVCSIGQVSTIFTVLNIEVSQAELDLLAMSFGDGNGGFLYREFASVVSSGLGTDFLSSAGSPCSAAPPTPSASRWRPSISKSEAPLQDIEAQLAKHAVVRKIDLKSEFQDFDRTNSGRVTRHQFFRIMDNVGGGLSEQQLEMVFQTYSEPDRNENHRFPYAEFCETLASYDPLAPCHLARMPLSARTNCAPKYFNNNGDVMPIRRELLRRPLTR